MIQQKIVNWLNLRYTRDTQVLLETGAQRKCIVTT